MTPAEIEDRLLKADAFQHIATVLLGELIAALPADAREQIGEAMRIQADLLRGIMARSAQPADTDAAGLHAAAALEAIRSRITDRPLSAMDLAGLRRALYPDAPG